MSQHKIGIITDSTSDIPREFVGQYNLYVIPQVLIWGTEEYRDNVTITPAEFYTRLATDPVTPTSSQPVARDFVDLYHKVKEEGAEELVVIVLSNQLSGTLISARQAVEMVDFPVHVVDSLGVSIGLGFQVLAAARARDAGANIQGILAAAQQVRESSHLYFSLDTLEYLHRGGRIGGAAKLVGTALQLKPMLTVDFSTGRIDAAERTRTRAKAIQRMVDVFFEHLDTAKPMHIAVLHGNALEEANNLLATVQERCDPAELFLTSVSPVIGVHSGPGALGLCGYSEQ
nr:DegV family protein [Anaerolineae bacterium]